MAIRNQTSNTNDLRARATALQFSFGNSDMEDSTGFRWWSRWFLRASYLLMWGLSVTAMGSEGLLHERFANTSWPWPETIHVAAFATTLWLFWALWPLRESEPLTGNTSAAVFLLVVCVGVLTWQREHVWAVVGSGLVCAALFACGADVYRRSLVLTVAAWGLAGFAVLLFPWPNGQRYDLVFVLGGLATTLQGGFWLASDLIAVRRHPQELSAVSDNLRG